MQGCSQASGHAELPEKIKNNFQGLGTLHHRLKLLRETQPLPAPLLLFPRPSLPLPPSSTSLPASQPPIQAELCNVAPLVSQGTKQRCVVSAFPLPPPPSPLSHFLSDCNVFHISRLPLPHIKPHQHKSTNSCSHSAKQIPASDPLEKTLPCTVHINL